MLEVFLQLTLYIIAYLLTYLTLCTVEIFLKDELAPLTHVLWAKIAILH